MRLELCYHHIIKFRLVVKGVGPHLLICPIKWRSFAELADQPVAKFSYLGLVRGEINIFRALCKLQHVQIIGEPPVVLILADLGSKIRRIQHEQRTAVVLMLGKQFPVIHSDHFQTVKITGTVITARLHTVVHRVFAQFVQSLDPFAAEQHRAAIVITST